MRLLDLNCTFTSDVFASTVFTGIARPIMRSSHRAHVLACGSYVQTGEPAPGFAGSE
jgi:hypothetical protein